MPAAALRRRAPDLNQVLDAKLKTGQFPSDALTTLAETRPVLLEPTLGLPVAPEHLRYRSGLFSIEPSRLSDINGQHAIQKAILDTLGHEATDQRETLTTLAMTWLPTVVTRLRQGSADGALSALEAVDALSPGSRWAKLLKPPAQALKAAETKGDAARLAQLRAQLRATDFTGLFGP